MTLKYKGFIGNTSILLKIQIINLYLIFKYNNYSDAEFHTHRENSGFSKSYFFSRKNLLSDNYKT
jgi:hypothetical protein